VICKWTTEKSSEDDLPTVKRFKEVVAHDIQRRYVYKSEAVEEQNVAILLPY